MHLYLLSKIIQIVKVIFDHLFTEGNITLFKAALIILDFCEKAILAANEFRTKYNTFN